MMNVLAHHELLQTGYSVKDFKVESAHIVRSFNENEVYLLTMHKFKAASAYETNDYPSEALFLHAISKIRVAQKNKMEFALLSNVCCDQEECAHNLFYRCLVDVLTTIGI